MNSNLRSFILIEEWSTKNFWDILTTIRILRKNKIPFTRVGEKDYVDNVQSLNKAYILKMEGKALVLIKFI